MSRPRSGTKEGREGWGTKFRRLLVPWTIVAQVGWVVSVEWSAHRLLGSWALPLAVLLGAVSAAGIFPMVLARLPDRPRPRWQVLWLERPYFVHWSACHFSSVGLVLGLLWGLLSPVSSWWHAAGKFALAGYSFGWLWSAWGATVGCHRFRVRHLTLRVPSSAEPWNGYRIVHLSDLHIGSFVSDALLDKWISASNEQRADLVVITGDLVSSGVEFHERIATALGKLQSKDGVLYVPGNHDYFGEGEPLQSLLRQAGIVVLRNEAVVMERNGVKMAVVGVDDAWTGRGDEQAAMSARPRDVALTVALVHDPESFDRLAALGADIVLAGHTHGGQIAIPGLARWLSLTAWSSRYPLGEYRLNGSRLVVSAGLGCTALPLRLGVRGEILTLELRTEVS